MREAGAAACGALMGVGLLLVVRGYLTARAHRQPRTTSPRTSRWVAAARRHRRLLALGGGVGLAVWIVSAMPLLGFVAAIGTLVLPWLLSAPANEDLHTLEALDRWVRTIGAILPAGRSITDAVRISRRQAPDLLAPGIDRVVARIDQRWTLGDALRAMADEIASPDADAVIAALILASSRGGTGAAATMTALSDSIQDRLRALREIEAERAKPRVVVRQVTIISLVLLGAAWLFSAEFFEPYFSPLGQVILGLLLACYLGSLVMLRQMTNPPRRERILRSAS